MTTASKRKGSQYERDVVKWLRDQGWVSAERAYGAGRNDDVGDIDGTPFCVECKATKVIDLPGFLRELETEMVNGRFEMGVVLVKRRGSADVGDSYAVMPASLWARLAREANYG